MVKPDAPAESHFTRRGKLKGKFDWDKVVTEEFLPEALRTKK